VKRLRQETPIFENLAAEMEARRRLAELHDDDRHGLDDLGDYIRRYAAAGALAEGADAERDSGAP
jgi:hypothetical protein